MDRYHKVEKPKPEIPINENEIRITSQGAIRNYITYASTLLQEKRVKEIVLKAMGQAINKTVAIAEIIKKRIPLLHQDTAISSVSITDVWEPIEEGLLPVEMTRHVSIISITLSARELNKNSPGYQVPQHVEQPKPQFRYHQHQHQNQRHPPRQEHISYNAVNEDSYDRGRGRGRSYGRGGYGNYGTHQENDGHSNWGRGGGRGRENDGYSNWGRGGGRGRENDGYSNWGRGGGRDRENDGYSNWGSGGGRGRENDGYSNWGRGGGRGRENDGYSNRGGGGGQGRENDGYSNWGRGGGRGRDWGYRGPAYERGGGGGGRGYGGGRGRMGGRSRGGGY